VSSCRLLLLEFLKKFLNEYRDDDIVDPAFDFWAELICLLPGIAYWLRWPSIATGFLIAQIAPRTDKVDGIPSAVCTARLCGGAIFLGRYLLSISLKV
jgi:hypothetical protein